MKTLHPPPPFPSSREWMYEWIKRPVAVERGDPRFALVTTQRFPSKHGSWSLFVCVRKRKRGPHVSQPRTSSRLLVSSRLHFIGCVTHFSHIQVDVNTRAASSVWSRILWKKKKRRKKRIKCLASLGEGSNLEHRGLLLTHSFNVHIYQQLWRRNETRTRTALWVIFVRFFSPSSSRGG